MADQKKCFWILDAPRFRSHLFFRFLSTHPSIDPIYHPFIMPAMFGPEHLTQHFILKPARQKELDDIFNSPLAVSDTYSTADEAYKKAAATALSQKKTPLSNEHWFNLLKPSLVVGINSGEVTSASELPSNPTMLSDDAFASFVPIILIRNPTIFINSVYRDALQLTQQRPGDEDFTLIASLRWARILYDFFVLKGAKPLVVDGEAVLWNTEEITAKTAEFMGLEEEGFTEIWEPTSKEVVEKMHPIVYKFTQKVHDSRGLERQGVEAGEPDLSKQVEKWKELYGGEVSQQLEAYVNEAMPDYRYLLALSAGYTK